MKKAELILNVALVPVDFLMLVLAGVVAYLIRTKILDTYRTVQFSVDLPFERYMITVAIVAVIFVFAYAVSGLYVLRTTRKFVEEAFRVALASSAGLMVVIVYMFLRAALFNSRFLVLGAWLLAILFVSLGRLSIRKFQHYLAERYDIGSHRV